MTKAKHISIFIFIIYIYIIFYYIYYFLLHISILFFDKENFIRNFCRTHERKYLNDTLHENSKDKENRWKERRACYQ